jgi:hypothetical protein
MGVSLWLLGVVALAAFCAGGFAGILVAAIMYMAHGNRRQAGSIRL